MARKALLSNSQCQKIRMLHENGASAVHLAKRFRVSESSLYKVLDGSYKARMDERKQILPIVPVDKPAGITPSLFGRNQPCDTKSLLAQMLEKAQQLDDIELDDLTVAAAELVVAKAKLERVLAHVH